MKFDKYEYYSNAVQSCDNDVLFLRKVYKHFYEKAPTVLREDFCGTFQMCEEWIKLNKNNNIRFSYQTAYRFPSTQQQYINPLKKHRNQI